jgi:hypothetical protein
MCLMALLLSGWMTSDTGIPQMGWRIRRKGIGVKAVGSRGSRAAGMSCHRQEPVEAKQLNQSVRFSEGHALGTPTT